MRGFWITTATVLAAIGIGIGALAGFGDATLAGAATASGANAAARATLAKAPLPASARAVAVPTSGLLSVPFERSELTGLVDLARVVRVDLTPAQVLAFVRAHLPAGARVTGSGTSGSASTVASDLTVELAVSGPHLYLDQLLYAAVPDGSGSTVRVDGQVAWYPTRSASEAMPSTGVVSLTGYDTTPLDNASSGAVAVRLDPSKAAALSRIVDALAVGPQPACMEDALLYRIVVRPSVNARPSFSATGWGCESAVTVTVHGKALAPLSDGRCSLLRAVVGDLPATAARGTRAALASCSAATASS